MTLKFPTFNSEISKDPSTRRIWYGIGTAHDLESHDGVTREGTHQKIFASHFGHLGIIFLWTSGNLFHVAWQGNFEEWVSNPLQIRPIAHAIWDPHFGQAAIKAFTRAGAEYPVNIATSGIYHWWFTVGMRSNDDLYAAALGTLTLACAFLFAGWLHLQPRFRPGLSWFTQDSIYSRLSHHISGLFGLSSIAWSGHLVHVAIPESRGIHVRFETLKTYLPHPAGLKPLFTGHIQYYAADPDKLTHVFGTKQGSGTAILTFLTGVLPQSHSLWLTDIAHHHLALGVLLLVLGAPIGDLAHRAFWDKKYQKAPLLGKATASAVVSSLHLQLALALASLGTLTSLTAQHMYALPAYAFIAADHVTEAALYTHHQYIAGFLMVGGFAHGAIFLVRDYDPYVHQASIFGVLLKYKEAIISLLSWVSLFLGFHTLGLYIHNDTCQAFGTPERQLLFEPVFAQLAQSASGVHRAGSIDAFGLFEEACKDKHQYIAGYENYTAGDSTYWLPAPWNVPYWICCLQGASFNPGEGSAEAIEVSRSVYRHTPLLAIGPGDFLVHHAIALGLHTTTLILVKGALDARGSKLMPDKADFGYSFPCDGPGRGGTCDISAWDAFYLAVFWMLNTISWTTFYWHWKHLAEWSGNVEAFNASSTYLMGWFSDYLWLNSSTLINGYNPFGMNAESVWAWMFLFGHLIWATGFMFLISWRGYWQELVETLVWAHDRTPIANILRWKDKPIALSIVQARLVGLTHFAVGYIFTYAPFLISSTNGKFG